MDEARSSQGRLVQGPVTTWTPEHERRLKLSNLRSFGFSSPTTTNYGGVPWGVVDGVIF